MGRVDLAMRQVGRFRRFYAIKHLHPHLTRDPHARAMLIEEGRIGGLLSHPNVVAIQDVGEDAQGPFLVMDYVEGLSLGAVQQLAEAKDISLPVDLSLSVAMAIAWGLHAIHTARDPEGQLLGLVHRDLSPRNVLVGYDGSVRVTDFGLAKAKDREIRTTTGVLKGTIGYLAPERLRFEEPDPRSDLFSLGVILYELLAGERLYAGGGTEAARDILQGAPPDIGELRLDAPPALTALLFRLLARARDDRPSSAAAVAGALESMLAELRPDLDDEEGAADIGTFLEHIARERRRAERRWVEEAVTRLRESNPSVRPPQELGDEATWVPSRPLRSRWPGRVLFVLAIGALLAITGFGSALAYQTFRRSGPESAEPAAATGAPPLAGSSTSTPTEPPDQASAPEPAPPSSSRMDGPRAAAREAALRRARRARRQARRRRSGAMETSEDARQDPQEMTWSGELR